MLFVWNVNQWLNLIRISIIENHLYSSSILFQSQYICHLCKISLFF